MSPPRILFDTNVGSQETGYWLGFDRSKAELERNRKAVTDGAAAVIYMPDELEMMATLRFDRRARVWWADPIPRTIKYLDGTG